MGQFDGTDGTGDFGNCGRNGRTVLSVQFMNDIRLVTSSSDPAQPSICELGEPRPGNGFYSALVDDIRDKMDRQNDEGDRVDDGDRAADVEAEG